MAELLGRGSIMHTVPPALDGDLEWGPDRLALGTGVPAVRPAPGGTSRGRDRRVPEAAADHQHWRVGRAQVVGGPQKALPQPCTNGAAVLGLPGVIGVGGAPLLHIVGIAFSDKRNSARASTLASIAFTKVNL